MKHAGATTCATAAAAAAAQAVPFHVWQVVELDHCLGVPFGDGERDASNRNVFDREFLQSRDLAIADLNKEMGESESGSREIERNPQCLLLRLHTYINIHVQ